MSHQDLHLNLRDMKQFRPEAPYTKKLVVTERTILMIVCLKPGQFIPAHAHTNREALVHALEGEVRFTPGEGPAEIRPGEIRFYDGATAISPRNVGKSDASFLVTLVRKKHA